MANVLVGSARSDERGKLKNGQAGDQTGKEVSTQNWYLHSKGWVVIRAKDSAAREKIAKAMEAACSNSNIGYDQNNRLGLYNAVSGKGFNPANCTVKTETDCSALVRVCVLFAGIQCGNFTTANEVSTLRSTGKFDTYTDDGMTKSSNYLLRGDILCTKTKGHTVVVLSNGAKVTAPTNTTPITNKKLPEIAKATLCKGSKGQQVKYLQHDLNYVLPVKMSVDGIFGNETKNYLMNFQTKYGLVKDGIYGIKSEAQMRKLIK